jgi:fermentation-respiration switch protein FrsA (DUF1100 family)
VGLYHAVNDDTVPYRFSTELESALKMAGRDVSLTSYPDGGHSFAGPVRIQAAMDVTDFLNREDQ